MYRCQWISSISTGLLRWHAVSFVLLPWIHYLSTLKRFFFPLKVHKILAPSQMLPIQKKLSVFAVQIRHTQTYSPSGLCTHIYPVKSHRQTPCTFDTWFWHNMPNSIRSVCVGHILMKGELLLDTVIFYATFVVWLWLFLIEIVLQMLCLLVRK